MELKSNRIYAEMPAVRLFFPRSHPRCDQYVRHVHGSRFLNTTQGRGSASPFRQFKTHIYQKLDLFILHACPQRHAQPMGLIHMPAREDARFLPEGTNQSGIALEIHHTEFALAGQSQILSGDVHDDRKPLSVPFVAEHQKTGILGKEMLALNAVGTRQIGG